VETNSHAMEEKDLRQKKAIGSEKRNELWPICGTPI
jgi:hypothetical protein